MFELLLLTLLLTAICIAVKAWLAKLEFKEGLLINPHPDSCYPPVSREQRN